MRLASRNGLPTLGALVLVTAALYFGRPLLMPIALALLLSFCMAPLVLRIERIGVGRLLSAIAVTLLIGSLLAGVGWLVASQTAELAAEMPTYRKNLRGKIEALREPLRSLDGAAESISEIEREIQTPSAERPAAKVEVVEPPSVVSRVGGVLSSVIDPLAMVGLVAVLALFMLLEREELRDRLIWLTGGRDLSVTTRALEDAERRVMRYLGTQSLLCVLHGAGVTAGLLWIGLPGAAVWGTLSALLRFLPYFGPWIAAALPITLSIAAFPDWQSTALTAGLFVTLELVSNNVLEPWLYGTRTGLSPFGVIFSAFFWTWLWGIPGLILATPLTVCLVVAGRYVRSLEFISVMLGDQPALAAEMRFYQRLLALDLDEADEVMRACAADASLEEVTDLLVLPALRRLAEDEERELVPPDRGSDVRQRLSEMLEQFLEKREGDVTAELAGVRALLVPAHSPTDAAAARWLALLLSRRGADVEVASEQALVSEIVERVAADPPHLICISSLTDVALPHARLLRARLTALPDHPEIAAGYWAAPAHELPDAPTSRARWITRATELAALAHSVRARLPSSREEEETSGAGGASFSWGMGGR
jgi:predicted PurR-regulated permease PerM